MKSFQKKKKEKREEKKTNYRATRGRRLQEERAEAAQVAEAERAAQGRFAEPIIPGVAPGFTSFKGLSRQRPRDFAIEEPAFAVAEPAFAVAEPAFARAEPAFARAEPAFARAERRCPTDIPRCHVVESGDLHMDLRNPIEARVVKMPKKLTYFDSDDSDDSDMSIGSNSNSPKKTSRVKTISEITRDIFDRKLAKTRVKDIKTLEKAITDTKGLRKFLGLDTEDNPDCSICSLYLYSKLLESSPDNTSGFIAMKPEKFQKYSSGCRDNACGGISNSQIMNLFKDNGVTNLGMYTFRVESYAGIKPLLDELLNPGEVTILYLPHDNTVFNGHIVLVYAHPDNGDYYIIDIQENPLQFIRLSDYDLSNPTKYEKGGFIGLMVEEVQKVKRAKKRVTAYSGNKHDKLASINKLVKDQYDRTARETEPSSPISVRKQENSENPRKRQRTLGGSSVDAGRKTRKTRK